MSNKEFARKVQADIAGRLGTDHKVSVKEIVKNNGVTMQGLLIYAKDRNITPTIYLEDFYERFRQGEGWDQIIERILAVYENSIPQEPVNMDFFNEFDKVKERIAYKLINAERNKELLSKIPHIRFFDLAICFYYAFTHETLGTGSILVYNSQVETWKTNTVELHKLAGKNTAKLFGMELLPMEEFLKRLLEEENGMPEETFCDLPQNVWMQILTNRARIFGAAGILYPGVLKKIAHEAGANLYILPSSVHEVILLAETGEENVRFLKEMVREVNETQLLPEEVLSDSVYYYDREKREIICF